MDTQTDTYGNDQAAQMYGNEVLDNSGNKIGTIDGVWVDDATGQLEFVSVKTGWLFGKTHLIPMQNGQTSGGTVTVPYDQEQIKGAPSFDSNAELSPADEDGIYSYYGLQRETADSPSGLADSTGYASSGYTGTDAGIDTTDTTYARDTMDTGTTGFSTESADRNISLSEEELSVGKRTVESGRVRLRKVVHTERVEQPVELRHEEIQIERVSATDGTIPDDAFQEGEIEVPVMREEAVVGKTAQVTGQVRVNKEVQTETENVGGEIRREDVEVERDGTSGLTGTTNRSAGYSDDSIVTEDATTRDRSY